jgi:hypothetical protein
MMTSPIAQAIIQHYNLYNHAILVDPSFNAGDLVVYEGSVEELHGQAAYVADIVEQPEGKRFRYRYVLKFKNGEVVKHVRPTSFSLRENLTEKQVEWCRSYREAWEQLPR